MDIDIVKCKIVFSEYVKKYDINNDLIKLKLEHTYRTSEASRKIASLMKLSKVDIELANLIGLLHDIGRFEQLRVYNTFNDKKSIDHGDFGAKILFEDNEIRNYINNNIYDEVINKAIKNHNKYCIEDTLNDYELLHTKIIRDADKIDNFYLFGIMDLNVLFNTDDLHKALNSEVNPIVLDDFFNERQVLNGDVKSTVDNLLLRLTWVYDLNFNESIKYVKDNDYINKFLNRLPIDDKELFDNISNKINEYINKKSIIN